jgi:hypothetical protein
MQALAALEVEVEVGEVNTCCCSEAERQALKGDV